MFFQQFTLSGKDSIREILRPYNITNSQKIDNFFSEMEKGYLLQGVCLVSTSGLLGSLVSCHNKSIFLIKPFFTSSQMLEIRNGIMQGLTFHQLSFIVDPVLKPKQMNEIKEGIVSGLSSDQIRFFAKTRYKWKQMRELRLALQNGLSLEEVVTFAHPSFNYKRMEQERLILEGVLKIG